MPNKLLNVFYCVHALCLQCYATSHVKENEKMFILVTKYNTAVDYKGVQQPGYFTKHQSTFSKNMKREKSIRIL